MNSVTARRAWVALLAIPGVFALAWLMLPTDSAPAEAGRVTIAGGASSPSPAPVAIGDPPIRRTPPDRARNEKLAQEQSYLVAYEERNRVWAERSEAAILNLMRGIAYVGRGRFLEIKCAASACEVSGMADADPATGSLKPVWEALERDTAGEDLRRHGLERTATLFDTGRAGEEFKIYYRRIDSGEGNMPAATREP